MNLKKFFTRLSSHKPSNDCINKYFDDASALVKVIDFSTEDLNVLQQHPERVNKEGSKYINWYLPSFGNAFYGGVMTILRFAEYLTNFDTYSRFLICGSADRADILQKISKAFPKLEKSEVCILDTPEKY
ncbi:MAG: hypothetical protein HC878_16535 [Leptolyngbyaceae cyanobacterium SL_5_14]|nr:hypothetical protein [Leptolyngbyaceae cyanobacterium SL_5_14]